MERWIKKRWIIACCFILLLIAGLLVFLSKKSENCSNLQNTITSSTIIPYPGHEIHISHAGDLSKPKVLLIHGSPGSCSDFKFIFMDTDLLKNYCLISYDRPAYGKTTVPVKNQLSDQAKVALKVISHFTKKNEKLTVLGHSYGGAVLEQILLDYPMKIARAIYIAPCLCPTFQKAKWYNYIIAEVLPNKLIPRKFRVSNTEMMALQQQLKENEKRLSGIKIPTTYIQGKKDILVAYQSQEYYLKYHKNVNHVLLKNVNHFIPWSNPELIIDAIEAE